MKRTTKLILFALALVLLAGGVLYRLGVGVGGVRPTPYDETGSHTGDETLIVAFGDSLTAGYGLPLAESYPAILERTLQARGYAVRVINAGISGETTAGARERAAFIRSQSPDLVLLGIGGNDALRFLPIANTRENLQEILATLTTGEDAPQVLLLQMQAPQNAGVEYKKTFDALYPELAERYGVPLVPFLSEEVFRDRRYLLEDGIHPNAEGYAFLVNTYIAPALASLLPKPSAPVNEEAYP